MKNHTPHLILTPIVSRKSELLFTYEYSLQSFENDLSVYQLINIFINNSHNQYKIINKIARYSLLYRYFKPVARVSQNLQFYSITFNRIIITIYINVYIYLNMSKFHINLQGDDQGCGSWIWLKLQEVHLYDK